MLRAVIEPTARSASAEVPPFTIAFADHSEASLVEAEAAARRGARGDVASSAALRPLAAVRSRVTRVAAEDWRLHLSIDALILDGESNNLLLEEVFDHLPWPDRSAVRL